MKKKNTRWVLQVKGESHGHQVIEAYTLYMRLTQEQIELMAEMFDTSDLNKKRERTDRSQCKTDKLPSALRLLL